jgi:hypothetical protein
MTATKNFTLLTFPKPAVPTIPVCCPRCKSTTHTAHLIEAGTFLELECSACSFQLLFVIDLAPTFPRENGGAL